MSFQTQVKGAIKKVYKGGKEYRKRANPTIETLLEAKFHHAMTVSGMLGDIPCNRLVIDPGNSISMIDVRTARKGPIPIVKESKLTFQLANGQFGSPIGETKSRQVLDIEGVRVKLRMPVVDSNDSYDVLLGRDWLHAVDAVAHYSKNQYSISRKGKSAVLQGRIYTQKEVELSYDSSTTESESDVTDETESSSSSEGSSSDERENESAQAFLATGIGLDQFDVCPTQSSTLKILRNNPAAMLPVRATEGAAGYDLFSSTCVVVEGKNQVLVPTGISMEIPEGYFGLIKPRSGLALHKKITVDAGVIDRDYGGEIQVLLVNRSHKRFVVEKGDRIAQILIIRNLNPKIEEVATLAGTLRGSSGFGSTGSSELHTNPIGDQDPSVDSQNTPRDRAFLYEILEENNDEVSGYLPETLAEVQLQETASRKLGGSDLPFAPQQSVAEIEISHPAEVNRPCENSNYSANNGWNDLRFGQEVRESEMFESCKNEGEMFAGQLTVEQLVEININPNLSPEQLDAGKQLLWEFRHLFANNLEEMGHTNIVQHEINLKPGVTPYYTPGTHQFAPAELEAIYENLQEELRAGKIIEAEGPWCAPIVVAKKKDGTFRKCIAYNGLNDRTE